MSQADIGPKERQVRELREQRAAKRIKPTPDQLRIEVAKIKPKRKKTKKGKRK